MILCVIILIILLIAFCNCTDDIFLSILATVIEIPNEPKTVVIESYITDGEIAYVKFDDKIHKYARDKFNIDTTLEPNTAKIESCRIDHPDWMFWVISPCVNIGDTEDVVNKISINPND